MTQTTTARSTNNARLALDEITIGDNVRALDPDNVAALTASIKLRGLLVPLIVRPVDGRHQLVAGHHRLAACRELGHTEIDVTIREHEGSSADSAAENITRKQLTPLEEAHAVQAMLDEGYTLDGTAQALGWSTQLVNARAKILKLPARAQQMLGQRTIALSSIDQLLAIGTVSPPLLDAVITFLDDGNEFAAERLAREPGWVLDSALRNTNTKAFAAYMDTVQPHVIADLRLGKKTDELHAQAEKLHRQINRHAYGPPTIRLTVTDVDQARAAGVLIEFDRGRPIIVDRSLYRELVKAAIKRTVETLTAQAADVAKDKQARRSGKTPDDPHAAAERERNAQLRGIADQAHGANLDLGSSLLTGLSVVDPNDINVARFFVYALLGPDHDNSPYTQTGERIERIAMGGIRLCFDELRSDVTKKRKDGSLGRMKIDYGKDATAAQKWLWKFIDGAKSPGEIYGRALVVIAAQEHASRLVLPTAKRGCPLRFSSHKDHAAKALAKLAGEHVPASLRTLQKSVARAHREHDQAITALRTTASTADAEQPDADNDVDEDLDGFDDED